MTTYRAVSYDHAGKTYAGTWHVDGDKVLISSAYGSKVTPIGRHKSPDTVALSGMAMIVQDYLTQGRP